MSIEKMGTNLTKAQFFSRSLYANGLLATSWLLLVLADVYSAPGVCL